MSLVILWKNSHIQSIYAVPCDMDNLFLTLHQINHPVVLQEWMEGHGFKRELDGLAVTASTLSAAAARKAAKTDTL